MVTVTLLWFFSTGAILWLNRMPRETHPQSITLATMLAGAAMCGIIVSLGETGPAAAYLGFAGALVIWGWHEMSFLMGFVNGPRRTPCPAGVRGWRRFRVSAETVIHHELALAATLLALVLLSWDRANPIAALTFGLLFALRLSAKLNIFLGVANLAEEMMPEHLAYLKSYFRKRRFNALFPLSIAATLMLSIWLGAAAVKAEAGEATGYALLCALAVLGLAEHVLMMLPLQDAALWRWASPARNFEKTGLGRRQ